LKEKLKKSLTGLDHHGQAFHFSFLKGGEEKK
jgi:hypothetical protein